MLKETILKTPIIRRETSTVMIVVSVTILFVKRFANPSFKK